MACFTEEVNPSLTKLLYWIFCRRVSGFATDCPCDVWCRGLTTCLLHVGPPFGNLFLNTSWAVGLTYWIVYLHFFCILAYAIIYVLIHHIIFWLYLYFLNILYFIKYSCTNIFHRRSLCTFWNSVDDATSHVTSYHLHSSSLEQKCCHFDEIILTGCPGICQSDISFFLMKFNVVLGCHICKIWGV